MYIIYIHLKYKEQKRSLQVSKANFYVQKMKNHLPAVILKFFITPPNVTSNFETHKDVGDKFWLHI